VVLLTDSLLTPFIAGDYRPGTFWFFVMDRSYFLGLAAAQAFLASDANIARFCVTITALLLLVCSLVLLRPFAAPWKFVVKVYSLGLCVLAACLNLLTSQQGISPAIAPLGVVVVVASIGLFIALGSTFFLDIMNAMPTRLRSSLPTEAEAVKQQATMRRASSARVSVYVNPLLSQGSAPRMGASTRVAILPTPAAAIASPRESIVSQRMRLHRASNVAMSATVMRSTSTRKPTSVRKVPNAPTIFPQFEN
jgi:hypothetical protein